MSARITKLAIAAIFAGLVSAMPGNYGGGYAPVGTAPYSSVPHPAYGTGAPYHAADPHHYAYGTGAPSYPHDIATATYVLTLTTKLPCEPYVVGTETLSYTASEFLTTHTVYQTVSHDDPGYPVDAPTATSDYPVDHPTVTGYDNGHHHITLPTTTTTTITFTGCPPKETVYVTVPTYITVTASAVPTDYPAGHDHPAGDYPADDHHHHHTDPSYSAPSHTDSSYIDPTNTDLPSTDYKPGHDHHGHGCVKGSDCYEGPAWTDIYPHHGHAYPTGTGYPTDAGYPAGTGYPSYPPKSTSSAYGYHAPAQPTKVAEVSVPSY